jgi:hypothetical protein
MEGISAKAEDLILGCGRPSLRNREVIKFWTKSSRVIELRRLPAKGQEVQRAGSQDKEQSAAWSG